MPSSCGQLGRDLGEALGLQLGRGRHRAGRRAARVVLGQPVGGHRVGVARVADRVVRVVGPLPALGRRVVLLRVERVPDRRLDRLVVGRQGRVLQARGHEERRLAVRDHDVGRAAVEGVHSLRVLAPVGIVVRVLRRLEVDGIVADPFALALVPPDQPLPLGPRLAVRVGRRAVVQVAPVARPGEAPAEVRPRPVRAVGHPVARLVVILLRVGAAVDPAAAGGRSVVLELLVALDLLLLRPRVAVDLLQHLVARGLALLPVDRVVPGQVLDRLILWIVAVGVELLQPGAQVVDEPESPSGCRPARSPPCRATARGGACW